MGQEKLPTDILSCIKKIPIKMSLHFPNILDNVSKNGSITITLAPTTGGSWTLTVPTIISTTPDTSDSTIYFPTLAVFPCYSGNNTDHPSYSNSVTVVGPKIVVIPTGTTDGIATISITSNPGNHVHLYNITVGAGFNPITGHCNY